jgi:hypothetical protein
MIACVRETAANLSARATADNRARRNSWQYNVRYCFFEHTPLQNETADNRTHAQQQTIERLRNNWHMSARAKGDTFTNRL